MKYLAKIIALFTVTILSISSYAHAQGLDQRLSISGKSFIVYYDPDLDLKRIERCLRARYFPLGPAERDAFSSPAYPVEDRLCARLDSLLKRVKAVLGMNPYNINLSIKIFKNRQDLKDEYFRIFKAYENYKSFYVHGLKTIYTSAQDISDTIIIHELGHAVVDHYFNQIPPTKVAELLANYVDLHLEE
jgi:hypothetical protein